MTDKEVTKLMLKVVVSIDAMNQYEEVVDAGFLSHNTSMAVKSLGDLGLLLQRIQEAIDAA